MSHLLTIRITAIPTRALNPDVRGVEVVIGRGGWVDSGVGDGEVFIRVERLEVDMGVDGIEEASGVEWFEVDTGEDDDSGTFVGIDVGGVEVGIMGGVDVG